MVDGPNTYAYATNNPTNYIDPDGRAVWGLNFGLGGTFAPGKGSYYYSIVLDDRGNVALQRTWETGGGGGRTGGFLLTEFYGTADTYKSLEGGGIQVSGSARGLAASISVPINIEMEFDVDLDCIGDPSIFKNPENAIRQSLAMGGSGVVVEFGISRGFKGREFGVTGTQTETIRHSDFFARAGNWLMRNTVDVYDYVTGRHQEYR